MGYLTGVRRPKGSRNKLAEKFLDDFYDIWQEEGRNALLKAARNSPARFIQVAAALIPQHFKFEHEHSIAGLSTEELRERLQEARARLIASGVELPGDAVPMLPKPAGFQRR